MTLGEKIKSIRKKEGITQEELAEKLNLSRSAIAKWETDNGVPDISNLKMISQIFSITIDELLDNSNAIITELSDISVHSYEHSKYDGFYYNIKLGGWNDGVYDVLIIGEDKDFIYYKRIDKRKFVYGLIGKKYITSLNRVKVNENLTDYVEFEGRSYFCMKHVLIELGKEGLIKGFFDFRDDDYRDVLVDSFTNSNIYLEFGKEIAVNTISKLEEIDSSNSI